MRRKRMLQQLDEDIREHLDRETQDNIDRGMPGPTKSSVRASQQTMESMDG